MESNSETPKTTTMQIAAAGLLVAMFALGIGLVAVFRAGDNEPAQAAAGAAMNMSPGMMEHMAAAPTAGVPAATEPLGGRPLAHVVESGAWVFRLETKPVRWAILPDTSVTAWTYNGTVPGPEIRVPYGQRVRIVVTNRLPEETTVHWHGLDVPNDQDGVPGVTQRPIKPGERFTYEFTALPAGRDSAGGTFLYHSHVDEDRQVGLGLSGAFIVEPQAREQYALEKTMLIQEWNFDSRSGMTRPAMDMDGMRPNYFTINGKSYPATETLKVRRGQRVLLRLVGAGSGSHPMHLHGTDFTVLAKDGHALTFPYDADVIQVGSGERYDITFIPNRPGTWIFHCHIGHHLTNDGEGPGGLMSTIEVT